MAYELIQDIVLYEKSSQILSKTTGSVLVTYSSPKNIFDEYSSLTNLLWPNTLFNDCFGSYGFTFNYPENIKKIKINKLLNSSNINYSIKNFKLQGSNDRLNWFDIQVDWLNVDNLNIQASNITNTVVGDILINATNTNNNDLIICFDNNTDYLNYRFIFWDSYNYEYTNIRFGTVLIYSEESVPVVDPLDIITIGDTVYSFDTTELDYNIEFSNDINNNATMENYLFTADDNVLIDQSFMTRFDAGEKLTNSCYGITYSDLEPGTDYIITTIIRDNEGEIGQVIETNLITTDSLPVPENPIFDLSYVDITGGVRLTWSGGVAPYYIFVNDEEYDFVPGATFDYINIPGTYDIYIMDSDNEVSSVIEVVIASPVESTLDKKNINRIKNTVKMLLMTRGEDFSLQRSSVIVGDFDSVEYNEPAYIGNVRGVLYDRFYGMDNLINVTDSGFDNNNNTYVIFRWDADILKDDILDDEWTILNIVDHSAYKLAYLEKI